MRGILVKALLLVLVINGVGFALALSGASAGAADVTFGAAAPILKRSLLLSLLAGACWIGIAAGVTSTGPAHPRRLPDRSRPQRGRPPRAAANGRRRRR